MGDATYAPRLLTLLKNSQNQDRKAKLLLAAAWLDATKTIPVIWSLLDSTSQDEREEAVNALAAIERPEVLPVLVQMLSDPSFRVRQAATSGLVSLTRKTPGNDGLFWSGDDPSADAGYWASWLLTNPPSPIHPIRECPQVAEQ